MFIRSDHISHPRYDSKRNKGSAPDPDYGEALSNGKIVHYEDTKAGVRYSYAGRFKFWIDGYSRETLYDLEARAGLSISQAKLTKKFLVAQMLYLDLLEPGMKCPDSKADCYETVIDRLSAGGIMMTAPKVMEILERLKKEFEEKFGKEPESPKTWFYGWELKEMFKKEEAEKATAAAQDGVARSSKETAIPIAEEEGGEKSDEGTVEEVNGGPDDAADERAAEGFTEKDDVNGIDLVDATPRVITRAAKNRASEAENEATNTRALKPIQANRKRKSKSTNSEKPTKRNRKTIPGAHGIGQC